MTGLLRISDKNDDVEIEPKFHRWHPRTILHYLKRGLMIW